MTATSAMIRQLVEQYQNLGLVTIPVVGKKPCSIVLGEDGQPLRRPDGRLVRWQPFVERFPTAAEMDAFEWDRATGLAVVIGPATGRAWPHLWALDIEAEHREQAERWLDEHVLGWRTGVVVETGGDGLHLYALASQPVKTGRVVWGEVRGQGAVCVLPPSIHPETGRAYRFLAQNWANLPQLDPAAVPGYQDSNGNTHEPLDVSAVLAGVPLGQRNTALFRLTSKLRGVGVPAPWALRLVEEAARNCTPPWGTGPGEEPPEKLVSRVYNSYEPNPELVVSNGRSPATGHSESDSDDGPEAVDVSTLPEPPRRGWLLPDLVPEGTVTTWFGDDGTGKSVLALALALSVASGAPYLGRPVKSGPVLYIDTEFDQDEFVRRAYQLARGLGLPAPPAGVLYFRTRYSLTTPGGQQDIQRLVEHHRPTLVVVDSVTLGTYSDDLKEAAAAVTLMEYLQRLPATVLALDHIPKPAPGANLSYSRPWGSFAKRAKTRHAVQVLATEAGGVLLRVSKSNLARPGLAVGADIRWTGDTIQVVAVDIDHESLAGIDQHLPPLEQVYQALATLGTATPDELAAETGLATGTVKNKLTVLRRQGRAEPLGDGRWSACRPPSLVTHPGNDQASPSSLVTHYRDSDSDGGRAFRDICDAEAQNGASGESYPQTFRDISDADAKNGAEYPQCLACGKVVTWDGTGRRPQYCSPACRKRAERQRKEPAPVDDIPAGQVSMETSTTGHGAEPPVCLDCGQAITAPGFEYRCPGCLQARYDALGQPYPEKLTKWLASNE